MPRRGSDANGYRAEFAPGGGLKKLSGNIAKLHLKRRALSNNLLGAVLTLE